MSGQRSNLPERVHLAVARQVESGGNAWDITEAACAVAAEWLREEQAIYRARQGNRQWNSLDTAFDEAMTQCANEIDPEVWRYLGEVAG